MKQIGLIGAGHMGSAILRGAINGGFLKAAQVTVCDTDRAKLEELRKEMPAAYYTTDSSEAASRSDLVILAVKPQYLAEVIDSIRKSLPGKAVVSIAAGWTVSMLSDALEGSGAAYLRVMPNTPAMVGEGMTAICDDTTFSEADFEFAKGLFEAIGKVVVLPEKLFDGVIAISGSSPAYVFMMIEAMADAGVKEGLPRSLAYEMAAQSVLGSALMVLTTGEHPAELKDQVCSPAGTTIEAVRVLEHLGFRSAVIEAMSACAEQSRKMSH